MGTNRRDFLKATLGAAGAAAACAGGLHLLTPRDASAAKVTLNFLFAGGTWKKWFEDSLTTPFSKEFGCDINISAGESAAQMVRVRAEKDSPTFDFIHIQQNAAMQLGSIGLLEEWTEDKIPNVKDVHPAFKNPYHAGKVVAPYGIAFNAKTAPKKVTSWLDLWDPAFKGRVGIPKWPWVGETWFHAVNKVLGGTEENVTPGIEKCRQLMRENKGIIIDSVEHAKNLFVSGEIWIAPYYTARTKQAVDAGAPLEFVFPKEGGLGWYFATAMIKGRPKESRDMGFKFANYTLDPKKQLDFSLLCGYPPTNVKAMALIPKERQADLLLTPEQMDNLAKIQLDYVKMLEVSDKAGERWNKEVLG
jgi:putative spermidine/putrescine transport system substrate-binding protein